MKKKQKKTRRPRGTYIGDIEFKTQNKQQTKKTLDKTRKH